MFQTRTLKYRLFFVLTSTLGVLTHNCFCKIGNEAGGTSPNTLTSSNKIQAEIWLFLLPKCKPQVKVAIASLGCSKTCRSLNVTFQLLTSGNACHTHHHVNTLVLMKPALRLYRLCTHEAEGLWVASVVNREILTLFQLPFDKICSFCNLIYIIYAIKTLD